MKKINYIDILIILFTFILLFVACYRFLLVPVHNKKIDPPELSGAVISLKVEGIRDFNSDLIIEGTELYCIDAEKNFGDIFSKTVESSKTYVNVNSGEIVISEHPNRKDVYLRVRVQGIQKNIGFCINNEYDIFIDDVKRFRCGDIIFYGQIKEINVLY